MSKPSGWCRSLVSIRSSKGPSHYKGTTTISLWNRKGRKESSCRLPRSSCRRIHKVRTLHEQGGKGECKVVQNALGGRRKDPSKNLTWKKENNVEPDLLIHLKKENALYPAKPTSQYGEGGKVWNLLARVTADRGKKERLSTTRKRKHKKCNVKKSTPRWF